MVWSPSSKNPPPPHVCEFLLVSSFNSLMQITQDASLATGRFLHPSSPLYQAIITLISLSQLSDMHIRNIASHGGLGIIINVLSIISSKFQLLDSSDTTDQDIFEQTCEKILKLMVNLTSVHSVAVTFVDKRGIGVVSVCLMNFTRKAKIQSKGLWVLRNLSCVTSVVPRLVQEQTFPLAISALSSHPRDFIINLNGFLFLENMMKAQPSLTHEIRRRGGYKCTTNAIKRWVRQEGADEVQDAYEDMQLLEEVLLRLQTMFDTATA